MNSTLENAKLSEDAKKNISLWLEDDKFSFYNDELVGLINSEDWHTLEDSFFRVLPFGTGGRRGTCGLGSNRVNRVTIGETVQALSDYLVSLGIKNASVGLAFDSRLTSVEFADYCVSVLVGNGLHAFVFDGPRATPELSFTVRDMNLDAGIVITASHNPSSDNGIKLYWSDGGQIVAPHDTNILACAEKTTEIREGDSRDKELVTILGKEQDERYWNAASSFLQTENRNLKIAYSPLHGTGITSVYPVLKKAGFEVLVYEDQKEMDGNFTNVTNNIPNPEVPAANDKVSEFALQENCDIATTNDPDADRYCVLVNDNGKGMVQLNGNQAAVLMTDYVLEAMQKKGELTDKHFIASTIVTTDMLLKLADHYKINSVSKLPVGFKYIGEQILLRHDNGDEIFVCGGEESYGGIISDYCRDKDAAGPTSMIAELAAELKKDNKTLLNKLDDLYEQHGYFLEDLHSTTFPGAEGFTAMKNFMEKLRKSPPKTIAGLEVLRVVDYLDGVEIEGKKDNVLSFEFTADGHNRVTIRPSGTEPKIKIYTQCYSEVEGSLEDTKETVRKQVEKIRSEIISLVEIAHG